MDTLMPSHPRGRVGRHLKVALIAWAFLSLILVVIFPKGTWPFALFVAAVPVGLVFNEMIRPRGAARYQIKGHPPFVPAFGADTIAIDTETDRVWLRDNRGKRYIFNRSDIAGWTHHWTVDRNFWGHSFFRENTLEIRTRDMATPTVVIAFHRYRDWTGANRNYRQAMEWKDRLSIFING